MYSLPRIPLYRRCYLCLRYEVLPMSPGSTGAKWWRRRELNPRPLVLYLWLYMLRFRLLI